jgi:catechol 1,2-dioxygenase
MTSGTEITQAAVRSFSETPEPRLRDLLEKIVRHLHALIEDARPTEEEWMEAIGFLTRTGQMCTDARQEFILLSDVLGASMLVDAINHPIAGEATESTVLGPFYSGQQRLVEPGGSILLRAEPGEPLDVSGTVRDEDGRPLPGATIEVWQTAPNGLYDVQDDDQPAGHLRATIIAGTDGCYRFRTVLPVSYPIPTDGPVGVLLNASRRHPYRPSHVHFMISAPGHKRLVTHLFVGGDPYLASDAVFGVKKSLIVWPQPVASGLEVRHDFALATD